jgi:hypothetical protein
MIDLAFQTIALHVKHEKRDCRAEWHRISIEMLS